MKFKTILLVTSLITSSVVQAQEQSVEDKNPDRPSRLAEGYGSDELLSGNLPYMPDISLEERIKFMGDIRLRSQTIIKEGGGNDDTEHKFRYRVRVGFEAAVNEQVKLEFMLATGEGDPVSTNQDFGEGFSGKNVVIDIADIFYEFGYHNFVRAGKMKLPFYRTHKNQMIWDNDLRPEGAFVKYKLFKDTDVTAGAFIVRNSGSQDVRHDLDPSAPAQEGSTVALYTMQAIEHFDKFRVGISANIYDSLKGQSPYVKYNSGQYSEGDGKDLSKGNTLDANGNYANDYHLVEIFGEYKVTDKFALGADFVYNTAASDDNFAYNFSAMYGKLKHNGDYKLGYYYRDTQKDAVLAAFSDSDFAGGYSGSKGHQLMAGYQLMKNTQLAVTYINARVDKGSYTQAYQRLHLDIKFKF